MLKMVKLAALIKEFVEYIGYEVLVETLYRANVL